MPTVDTEILTNFRYQDTLHVVWSDGVIQRVSPSDGGASAANLDDIFSAKQIDETNTKGTN